MEDNSNGPDEDQSRGFRFGISARFLSDLIGDLVEMSVTDAPTPSADAVDWTTVDEETDQQPEATQDRKRTKRFRKPSADCLLDTRIDDNEFVVLADIPSANMEELTVGIHPEQNDLVIGKDNTVLARVPLPWESAEPTKAAFNNGILEVRLRSTENGSLS